MYAVPWAAFLALAFLGERERVREMGIAPSKRVSGTLANSSEFDSACDSVYSECLTLTQHAFAGVLPYQLATASDRLHLFLSTTRPHPLITKWVPSPPARSQVDKALRPFVTRRSTEPAKEEIILGPLEFKAFAVDLFTDAIVSNAGKAVLQRVPIGIGGIVGVGIATRSGKDLVGTLVGVYALGVATSIYLNLSG